MDANKPTISSNELKLTILLIVIGLDSLMVGLVKLNYYWSWRNFYGACGVKLRGQKKDRRKGSMIRSLTRLPGGHTTRSQTTSRVSETAGEGLMESSQSNHWWHWLWVGKCQNELNLAHKNSYVQPYYCFNHKDLIWSQLLSPTPIHKDTGHWTPTPVKIPCTFPDWG